MSVRYRATAALGLLLASAVATAQAPVEVQPVSTRDIVRQVSVTGTVTSPRSAVLSTAVAYIIYFRILASSGATNILLVTFLIPVSAILLGVTILGETLQPRHFTGMLFIGLSLAAIDGRPGRWVLAWSGNHRGSGRVSPIAASKKEPRPANHTNREET